MTQEELKQAQDLLAQAAEHAVVKILQGEENKVFVEVLHYFEDKPTNKWNMTIEKVEE
ncbi:hypothetical protein WC29P3_00047 [Weissella phage WC29P3]|nr:hypothetical protein WC29P3_00047 [Weissella phage WC29P3]